jgi:arginine deiminase
MGAEQNNAHKQARTQESKYTRFIYSTIKSIYMSQNKIWMALTIIGGLFLLIGLQSMAYAQISNDTSMMGNATNATGWMGNATNATSAGNTTGNISGCIDRPGC